MRVCTRMHSISIIRYTSRARACTNHILYIPGLWRVLKWDPRSPTVILLSQCQANRVSRAYRAGLVNHSTEPGSQNLRRATLSLFLSVRAVVMWGVLMWVSCPVPLVTRPRSLCRHCTLSHAPLSPRHSRPRGTCLARCADVVEVDELAHP